MPRGRPRRTMTTRSRSPAPPRGGGSSTGGPPPSSSAASSVASGAGPDDDDDEEDEEEEDHTGTTDGTDEDPGTSKETTRGRPVDNNDKDDDDNDGKESSSGGRSDEDSGTEGDERMVAPATVRRTRGGRGGGRGGAKAVSAVARKRGGPPVKPTIAAARTSTRGRRGRRAAAAASATLPVRSSRRTGDGATEEEPPPPLRSTRPRRGKKDKADATVPAPTDDGTERDQDRVSSNEGSGNEESDDQAPTKAKARKSNDESSDSDDGVGSDGKVDPGNPDQEAVEEANLAVGSKRKRNAPTRSSKRGKRAKDNNAAVAPAADDDDVDDDDAAIAPATEGDAAAGPVGADDAVVSVATEENPASGPVPDDDVAMAPVKEDNVAVKSIPGDDSATGLATKEKPTAGHATKDEDPATAPAVDVGAAGTSELGGNAAMAPATEEKPTVGPSTEDDDQAMASVPDDESATGPATEDDDPAMAPATDDAAEGTSAPDDDSAISPAADEQSEVGPGTEIEAVVAPADGGAAVTSAPDDDSAKAPATEANKLGPATENDDPAMAPAPEDDTAMALVQEDEAAVDLEADDDAAFNPATEENPAAAPGTELVAAMAPAADGDAAEAPMTEPASGQGTEDEAVSAPAADNDAAMAPASKKDDPVMSNVAKDVSNDLNVHLSSGDATNVSGEPNISSMASDAAMDASQGAQGDLHDAAEANRAPSNDALTERQAGAGSCAISDVDEETADGSPPLDHEAPVTPSLDKRIPRKCAKPASNETENAATNVRIEAAATQKKADEETTIGGDGRKSSPTASTGDSALDSSGGLSGGGEVDDSCMWTSDIVASKSHEIHLGIEANASNNKSKAAEEKDNNIPKHSVGREAADAATETAADNGVQRISGTGLKGHPNDVPNAEDLPADFELESKVVNAPIADIEASNDYSSPVQSHQRATESGPLATIRDKVVDASQTNALDLVQRAGSDPPASLEASEVPVHADHPNSIDSEEPSAKQNPKPISDCASDPKLSFPSSLTQQVASSTLGFRNDESTATDKTAGMKDLRTSIQDLTPETVDSPSVPTASDTAKPSGEKNCDDSVLVETATPTIVVTQNVPGSPDAGGLRPDDPMDVDQGTESEMKAEPGLETKLNSDDSILDVSVTLLAPVEDVDKSPRFSTRESSSNMNLDSTNHPGKTTDTGPKQSKHGLHPESNKILSPEESVQGNFNLSENSDLKFSIPKVEAGHLATAFSADACISLNVPVTSFDSRALAIARQNQQKRGLNLRKVKMAIFTVGCKAHGRVGYERRFEEYWSLLATVIHADDSLNLNIRKHRAMINSFLTTKRLRKLHNKLVLGLLDILHNSSSSYQDSESTSFDLDKCPLSRSMDESAKNYRTCVTDGEDTSSPMHMKRRESVWRPIPYPPLVSEPVSSVVSAPKVYPVRKSFRIPGAMAVDPYLRTLADATGMNVSENSVWLIVVAMKEFVQTTLKSCIQMKKSVEAGQVPPVPYIRQRVLHKKRDIGDHRMASMSPKSKPYSGSTCITAMDVFALTSSMSIGNARSIGGTISRPAFELSQFSSYGLRVQPHSEMFDDLKSLITAKISPSLSLQVHYDPSSSSDLDTSSQRSRGDQSRAARGVGSTNDTTKGRAPHGGLGRGAKDLGALRARSLTQRSSAAAAAAAAAATVSQPPTEQHKAPLPAPSPPPSQAPVGSTVPVVDNSKAALSAGAATAEEESLGSSSPTDARASPQSQAGGAVRRGKGFGVKNLAAMRARSITKPAEDGEEGENSNNNDEDDGGKSKDLPVASTQEEQEQEVGVTPTETS